MKPNDLSLGYAASIANKFPTEDACVRAAADFARKHPGAQRYDLPNGTSFKSGKATEVEYRFTYPGSGEICYYVVMDGQDPVKNFGQLKKFYNKYLANGYCGRKAPHEDGGTDGKGGKTARCLLQSEKAAVLGQEFGLIINPPFPHGSPGYDKRHRRKKLGDNAYLLVLAGLVAGLSFRPLRNALRKRWSHSGR